MSLGIFDWDVSIAGTNIADIVPEYESDISYGRTDIEDQPVPTTATINIITRDAPDFAEWMNEDYPTFQVGGINSGFVDVYADEYEGATTSIVLGAPVTINANTPSGFTDVYVDEYATGDNYARFTGYITAIDYSHDRIQVTAAAPIEELTRIDVDNVFSAMTATERVTSIVNAAGANVSVEGTAPQVMCAEDDKDPTDSYRLIESVARDTESVFYCDRAGVTHFEAESARRTPATVTLPPAATYSNDLRMNTELGYIRNRVTVTYQPETRTTGKTTVEDSDSVAQYGVRDYRRSSRLQQETDASALAASITSRTANPHWMMGDVTVDLSMATDTERAAVAALELGDTVIVPYLLPGSPVASYQATFLGYTETLANGAWTVVLHLADFQNAERTVL